MTGGQARKTMPDGSEAVAVRVLDGIGQVTAEAWDACAGATLSSHAFLSALEDSGSATAETGWMPQHLVVENEDGRILAAAPLYLKSHSYGEYVFDWSWAEAYENAGGRYYPKLLSAVPFTPVTGRRLLVPPGAPPALADSLAAAMVRLTERLGLSSLHVTFPTESEWRHFGAAGFLLRTGQQFHWQNRGYRDFDEFLSALSSRKRKAIRKERRAAAGHGVGFSILTGADIEEKHWDAFHGFYRHTAERKRSHPYLTQEFFFQLGETMAANVVLVMADAAGRFVGGALNLLAADTLYGRYWGSTEAYKFLHFEVCYYQAIDFAIEHRLERVEAGAQGPHKLQRGYLPRRTYSAHWIRDAALREAVGRYLEAERAAIETETRMLTARSPFRSTSII